jgi:hypothetical protein
MLKIGKTQPSVFPSRDTNFDPWPMSIFTDYRIVSNYIELCTCKAIPDFTPGVRLFPQEGPQE